MMTMRELEVLRLLAQGYQNKEIARLLAVSRYTVNAHVKNIFEKLAVHKRTQAVERGLYFGYLSPEELERI